MTTAPERWQRIAAWFDELADLPPPARAARLAEIENEDAAAAAEVRALLGADQNTDSLLDGDVRRAVPSLAERRDTGAPDDGRAGPYRLLRAIGEGGMGTVFLAERSDGSYDQRVAVKLIKRGMDSGAIVRRFLHERRILARLAHPNIVRLLDGGMSTDARPYFVMEHVDGRAITDHAAARQLSIRERVALVATVADAVAYAHTQLVVHRDLKPSNVLVDAQGNPHVLDFGIAKLIEESGEQTLTAEGMRVLSPAYAAPEQVLGEAVGTATDVYALGLMLCELLVGELPRKRRGTTSAQLAQDVAYEVAERASAVARHLPRARAKELYGDAVTPPELARALQVDLDVVIATALQREPARRYKTAAAFADDLRRWLGNRPITAHAESASYRVRKFVRRHRVGVGAAVLVALSLIGGLGAALWQARIAQMQAQRADAERAHAERQLARTERVKDFILTLFHEQDPISRAKAQARSAPDLIRDGIAQIDATLAVDPDLQAELLRDLGEIQVSLDDRKGGEATLQRAWEMQVKLSGADSAASAETLAAYADAVYAAGDVTKSGTMLREAVTKLGATRGADDAKTAKAESSLAGVELIQGHYVEAERLARHAVEVYRTTYGADHAEVAQRLSVLGNIQQELAHHPDALASYDEALRIIERSQGADHVRTVILRTRIADVQRIQRKFDEALENYETALRIERAQLPEGHVAIGGTLLRLGDLQRRTNRFEDADRSLSEALRILGTTTSGQYAQALQFHGNLARAQGRLDVAVQRYEASLDVFRKATGDSIYTWLTALKTVEALTEAGRLEEADTLGTEAAAALAKMSKDDSYDSGYSAGVMGILRHEQGRNDESVALLRHSIGVHATLYGEDHAETARLRIALASSLIALRDAEARREAAALIETAKAALDRADDDETAAIVGSAYLERSLLRLDDGDVAGARADVAEAIQRLQAPADAQQLRRARALSQRLSVRA